MGEWLQRKNIAQTMQSMRKAVVQQNTGSSSGTVSVWCVRLWPTWGADSKPRINESQSNISWKYRGSCYHGNLWIIATRFWFLVSPIHHNIDISTTRRQCFYFSLYCSSVFNGTSKPYGMSKSSLRLSGMYFPVPSRLVYINMFHYYTDRNTLKKKKYVKCYD